MPSEPAKVFLIRAGANGEDEPYCMADSMAMIGFDDIPDLKEARSLAEVLEVVRKHTPEDTLARQQNRARQLFAFAHGMAIGDMAVMPLKSTGEIALGVVKGSYRYEQYLNRKRHMRNVDWQKRLPRTAFQQDMLNSLGAFMTVARIQRNDAEKRFGQLLKSGDDPGYVESSAPSDRERDDNELITLDRVDIGQVAENDLITFIGEHFREHDFTRLVEAILIAEGYATVRSPEGADGGVDILASQGSLGLGSNKLCVQVKSSVKPTDVKVFRELVGTMKRFNAEFGLLVSWGGFTSPAEKEARPEYFAIRFWGPRQVLDAIYANYERLPAEMQAELPLKRVWVRVAGSKELE